MMTGAQWVLVIAFGLMLLILVLMMAFMLALFRHWLRALLAGARMSVFDLLGMRLRGNPPGLLVDTLLALKYRGIEASIADVEKCYIANKGQVDQPARLAGMVEERLRNQREATPSRDDA